MVSFVTTIQWSVQSPRTFEMSVERPLPPVYSSLPLEWLANIGEPGHFYCRAAPIVRGLSADRWPPHYIEDLYIAVRARYHSQDCCLRTHSQTLTTDCCSPTHYQTLTTDCCSPTHSHQTHTTVFGSPTHFQTHTTVCGSSIHSQILTTDWCSPTHSRTLTNGCCSPTHSPLTVVHPPTHNWFIVHTPSSLQDCDPPVNVHGGTHSK